MQSIPPRLALLLNVLLFAAAPEPVANLAKRCGVSRRTIFREMSSIDGLLRPYGLSVGTKAGEGVYLSGADRGKEKLREALEIKSREYPAGPAGRAERRTFLALELLTLGEAQKLSYYADVFQVSEATVSYDLNSLDEKLSKYGVTVLKNPGRGAAVRGEESSLRNAICAVLLEAKRNGRLPLFGFSDFPGYPPPEVTEGVRQLAGTRFKDHMAWMTEESREALEVYMAVAVERIASGCAGFEFSAEAPVKNLSLNGANSCLPIADFFANSLELKFQFKFPVIFSEWERGNLALHLSASRKAANIFRALREGGPAETREKKTEKTKTRPPTISF